MADATLIGRAFRYGFNESTAPDAAQAARLALFRMGAWENPTAYTLRGINATIKHAMINERRDHHEFGSTGRRGASRIRRNAPADLGATNADGMPLFHPMAIDDTARAAIGRVDMARLIRRADKRLSAMHKRVLIYAVCGHTERETSAALGIAQQTVNKHKRRAFAILKERA